MLRNAGCSYNHSGPAKDMLLIIRTACHPQGSPEEVHFVIPTAVQ